MIQSFGYHTVEPGTASSSSFVWPRQRVSRLFESMYSNAFYRLLCEYRRVVLPNLPRYDDDDDNVDAQWTIDGITNFH